VVVVMAYGCGCVDVGGGCTVVAMVVAVRIVLHISIVNRNEKTYEGTRDAMRFESLLLQLQPPPFWWFEGWWWWPYA
jgi:hypothetical protein